jgi:hypothetical protein
MEGEAETRGEGKRACKGPRKRGKVVGWLKTSWYGQPKVILFIGKLIPKFHVPDAAVLFL